MQTDLLVARLKNCVLMIVCENLHVKLRLQPCARVSAYHARGSTFFTYHQVGMKLHEELAMNIYSPAVKWLLSSQRALSAPFSRGFTHTDTEGQLQVSLCLSFYGENSPLYQSLSKLRR